MLHNRQIELAQACSGFWEHARGSAPRHKAAHMRLPAAVPSRPHTQRHFALASSQSELKACQPLGSPCWTAPTSPST